MELVRIRQVATPLALALTTGCAGVQTLHSAYLDTRHAVARRAGLEHDRPATQVVCAFHRKLSPLPDPTSSDGRMTLGMTGQVFLQAADGGSAPAAGSVTFAVYDESPRAPGVPERMREVTHFDAATLSKLRTQDERFGPCYAVFLPWPKDWGTDVSAVRISARYDPTGGPFPLTAAEVKLTIDYKGEGVTIVRNGEVVSADGARDFDTRGVPDPALLQRQVEAGQARPAAVSAPRAPYTPPPELRVPPTLAPPRELEPPLGPPVGQFAPGTGFVVPPADPANTPYATEGAIAGPLPSAKPKGPVLPVAGAMVPLVVPGPGI